MSYNFDRVFLKVEQVNFQFMTEEFLHSDFFNKLLLFGHLFFLIVFLTCKWTSGFSNLNKMLEEVGLLSMLGLKPKRKQDFNDYRDLLIMFTSNLIGMIFSRGTHQQFYSWYSYTFPFLADAACGNSAVLTKLAIVLCLEVAWSVAKPRCPGQSYLLNFAHFFLLIGLLRKKIPRG